MTPAPPRSTRRVLALVAVLAIAAGALAVATPASAVSADAVAGAGATTPRTVWLCLPGSTNDPCAPPLTTTRVTGRGRTIDVQGITPVTDSKIDCFYVYPTVSDQPTPIANLTIDPEERSIALFQAAYFSRYCRVFAPMYRQVTLSGIGLDRTRGPAAQDAVARTPGYDDVLQAFRSYLKNFNHGRGIVFIGHSQGSFVLEELLSQIVDPNPHLRKLLVSAILLGGNVTVKNGEDVGGTFQHIPACRSDRQLGCVVAFSTFEDTPPSDSFFGRTAQPGEHVLCTNPASLATDRPSELHSVFPTTPFAPNTILAAGIMLIGAKLPDVPTPWVEYPSAYRGACTTDNGASVLLVQALHGAVHLNVVPTAEWGLHLVDGQIALGDLVQMIGAQAGVYAAATGGL